MNLIDVIETVESDKGKIEVRVLHWDFTEEVERGAALLDRVVGPDWHHGLELEELDLNSGYNCVLGQLAMSRFREQLGVFYESGGCGCGVPTCRSSDSDEVRYEYSDVTRLLAHVEDDPRWHNHATGNPARYGFYVSDDAVMDILRDYDDEEASKLSNQSWEHLTWTWMDEIRDRRRKERLAVEVVMQSAEAEVMKAEEMVLA